MATTAPGSKAPEQERPADDSPAGQALTGRAVIWAGLAAGTAITVLAVLHGIRIPGLQVVLSVLATWALLVIGGHHRRRAAPPPSPGPGPARGPARQARRAVRGPARPPRGARGGPRRPPRQPVGGRLPHAESGGPVAEPRAPAAHVHPPQRPGAADAGGHRGPGTHGRHRAGAAPTVRHRPWCRIFSTRRENHHGRHDQSPTTPPGPGSGPAAGSRRRTGPGTPRPGPAGPCRPNGPG